METPPPPQPPQDPASFAPPPAAQPHYAPPAGPAIRFDVIGQAFNMVFADLATWAVAALAIFLVLGVCMAIFYFALFAAILKIGFIGVLLIDFLGAFAISCVINVMSANMYRMAIIALSGTKPNVNEMFKFGPNTGNVLVVSLLVGLAVGIGSMFCYVPGLLAGGLLMFAMPLVVDRKMAPMDAINLSVKTLQKDMGMAAIFFLVIGLCAGIGGIACGIGLVLTLPVLPLAVTMLYRDYLGFASVPSEPS